MTTCRLHEADQQGGWGGVWNYKDRPSLWDTLERDWRRRARQERSKVVTISRALQRPNTQKSWVFWKE